MSQPVSCHGVVLRVVKSDGTVLWFGFLEGVDKDGDLLQDCFVNHDLAFTATEDEEDLRRLGDESDAAQEDC